MSGAGAGTIPTVPEAFASPPARPASAARRWWIAGALAATLVVVGTVAAWSNFHPKNFGIVQEGRIYRSGELTPSAMSRVVHDYHIQTVIDLGAYPENSGEEARARRVAKALGVTRYVLRLEGDATGNPNYYVQALHLINDPANQPVLVHCSAGTQRTGCLVMLQRHIVEGKAYSDVFREATDHRHDPGDNPHLLLMLADWTDKIAESYRTGAPIPGVEQVPEPKPVQ